MINSVRNAVLTILNKNNYGYISPSDFNLLAQNAQMEIYEEYYSNYNKVVNAENLRSSGTEYADVKKPIAEVLEQFLVSDFLVPKQTASGGDINNFYVPSITTTGNNSYMINKITAYTKQLASGYTDNTVPFTLEDSSADFIADGISTGDIVVNAYTFKSSIVDYVISPTVISLYDDIFQDPAFGEDYYVYSSKNYAETDKVSNANISLLSNSSLTSPSLLYPSYTIIGDIISVFPNTIIGYGAIKADYFRYPKVPKWTYSTLSSGEPVFNQSQPDYQDFELPTEDEYKLVTKILEYCGIVIREIEVSQFGSAQQQHEQPTFSMQQ
jgi:hypothetical protein